MKSRETNLIDSVDLFWACIDFEVHGIAIIMDQLINFDTASKMKNGPVRSPAFHSRGQESIYLASHDHWFFVARVYIELARCAHIGPLQ